MLSLHLNLWRNTKKGIAKLRAVPTKRYNWSLALVSELVYESHLKCDARKGLRVQIPPRALNYRLADRVIGLARSHLSRLDLSRVRQRALDCVERIELLFNFTFTACFVANESQCPNACNYPDYANDSKNGSLGAGWIVQEIARE